MDTTNFSALTGAPSDSRFALGRKWFWIGIVVALANVALGLIYGIALAVEKENRKEGIIIIAVAIVWVILMVTVVSPWLANSGLIPQYQLLKVK